MQRNRLCHLPFRLLGITLLAGLADAGVLVVNDNGNFPFADIPAALAVAVDGDIILVKHGNYSGFTITDKSISVIADVNATVGVSGSIWINGISSSKSVTLSGLRNRQVRVTSCDGPVRLLNITGDAPIPPTTMSPPAFEIADSHDVVLTGCKAFETQSIVLGIPATPLPMTITRSTVVLAESSSWGIRGLDGIPSGAFGNSGPSTWGFNGGSALRVNRSTVYLIGTALFGGAGGGGVSGGCGNPYYPVTGGGSGGTSLLVQDSGVGPASEIVVQDAGLIGGAGGTGGANSCGGLAGPNGPDGVGTTSPIAECLVGAHRKLGSIAPVREGQSFVVHVEGLPGDKVYFTTSASTALQFNAQVNGVVLYEKPFQRVLIGTIDASGVLDVAIPVSELGAGVQGRLRHAQAFIVDAAGNPWVTGSAVLLQLDSAL